MGVNTADASRDDSHLYRGDREALAESLDRIQRAASMILAALGEGTSCPIAPTVDRINVTVWCSDHASVMVRDLLGARAWKTPGSPGCR